MAFDQRLPVTDSDDGSWGSILNQFLSLQHYNTGLDNPDNGSHKSVTIRPGTHASGTAPLKFSSGQLLSAPEVGAVEFLTDKLYLTRTTNSDRLTIATYDDSLGASGDLYYRDQNGNFIRLPMGSAGQMLVSGSNSPTWSTILSGISKISAGTVAPESPVVGDLWVDTN